MAKNPPVKNLLQSGLSLSATEKGNALGNIGASRVLAASSTPVTIYGTNGSPSRTFASFTVPGGSLVPDSTLLIQGLCGFLLPNNAGRTVTLNMGATTIAQAFPTATVGGLQFSFPVYVSPDLQTLYCFSTNLNNVLSPSNGQGAPYSAFTNTPGSTSVDMTQDQVFSIQLQPINGDQAQLIAWNVSLLAPSSAPAQSYAPANALACWGDSLTAGTGAVTTGSYSYDYPNQLMRADPGRPVTNLGVGGNTSSQILTRFLRDKVRGKYQRVAIWAGRNDDWSTSGSRAATIANIQAMISNLAAGVKYIVGTVIPAANEPLNGTNWNNIVALNTAISTTFGSNVVDTFAALTSNGTAQIPISSRAVTASTTGTWSSGSNSITVASASGIVTGQFVAGTGIPDQTTVTNVSGTTVTISANTTASGSSAALSFVAANEVHLNNTGYATVSSTVLTKLQALGM